MAVMVLKLADAAYRGFGVAGLFEAEARERLLSVVA